MPWPDFGQPLEITERKGGVAVGTSSISKFKFFTIRSFREVSEVAVNLIVLMTVYSLSNCAHVIVSPITSFVPLNE